MKMLLLPLTCLLIALSPLALTGQTLAKAPNRNKIELLLRDVTVTRTSSNGAISSYQTEVPRLRFNDGPEVDYQPAIILPYLADCPRAVRQVELFQEQKKKSRQARWTGYLAGGGIALGGLIAGASLDPGLEKGGPAIFGAGFALGVGSMIFGGIQARKHRNEALRHMKNSVATYNRNCYQPGGSEPELAPLSNDALPPAAPPLPDDGVRENYQETLLYEVTKNDPQGFRFASVGLIIGDVDGTNAHGFTYRSGLSLRYHSSRFFADASYRLALVDNLTGTSYAGNNKSPQNPLLEPLDYQRAHEWSVGGGVELFGKNKNASELVDLGTRRVGGMPVTGETEIESQRWISWSLRAGVTGYRSVLYEEDGLRLSSSAEPRTEIVNPFSEETRTFYFDDMDNSMAMLRTTSLSVGISRRTVRNLEIKVQNTPYHGNKRLSYVWDWYADLLYAPRAELGSMQYYYEVNHAFSDPALPESFTYEVSPDATTPGKLGWRAGVRAFGVKGWELQVEIGQRPGFVQSKLYASAAGVYTWGREF